MVVAVDVIAVDIAAGVVDESGTTVRGCIQESGIV